MDTAAGYLSISSMGERSMGICAMAPHADKWISALQADKAADNALFSDKDMNELVVLDIAGTDWILQQEKGYASRRSFHESTQDTSRVGA